MMYTLGCHTESFVIQFALDLLRWFQFTQSHLVITLATSESLKLKMANEYTEAKVDLVVTTEDQPGC